MSRPEASGPADLFYNQFEVAKYTQNTRIMYIQRQMAERALQLLALPPNQPCLILDVGCGSGISGQVLTEAGHEHIGVDISPAMLSINDNPHLVEQDVGDGLTFTHGLLTAAFLFLLSSGFATLTRRARIPVQGSFGSFRVYTRVSVMEHGQLCRYILKIMTRFRLCKTAPSRRASLAALLSIIQTVLWRRSSISFYSRGISLNSYLRL